MFDVSGKVPSLRRAEARAFLVADESTLDRLEADDLPKKDPVGTARVAGLLAAKRTAYLIPDCHPIPIEHVDFTFERRTDALEITCSVKAVARTGVEMEALVGVTVAALVVYDMLKPAQDDLRIEAVALVAKSGGKSDYAGSPEGRRARVIVVSDSRARGEARDLSGPTAVGQLEALGFSVSAPAVVPDDVAEIGRALAEALEGAPHLVLLSGGTGLADRDVTREALKRARCEELGGLTHSLRSYNAERFPPAALSESAVLRAGKALVVSLPGNVSAVVDGVRALSPLLAHAFEIIEGKGHDKR